MPAINLDFTDDDYELVRNAAEHARLPVKSFARNAVLAHTIPAPATWTLVTSSAEAIESISPAAQELMGKHRGGSPEDGTVRANGCLWLHLTEPVAVIAYPTEHYTSGGFFEFVLDRHGVATVLREWWDESLAWSGGDAAAHSSAHRRAVAYGNRRLGVA